MSLVEISNLTVAFNGTRVLHGIDLAIEKGEAVGLVGESGCGKSVTWLAALGLLPRKATVGGSVRLGDRQLVGAPRTTLESVRGSRIAMIFQDPSSSLNPVIRAGRQIAEAVELHRGLTGKAARFEAIRLMELVGIPDAIRRFDNFPHEFSGGQNQRLMIAMALSGNPDLLVADEPTTALDATIQAQILDLLISIRAETGMAIVFISHDLGAVSQVCERVCVMYAGRVVEMCSTEALFLEPRHPYTRGLFDAIPRLDGGRERMAPIPGTVPQPGRLPGGCAFAPRCGRTSELCHNSLPQLVDLGSDRAAACFHPIGDGTTAVVPNVVQARQGATVA
jgi:peptide/nickel transport system ATP-binding protein